MDKKKEPKTILTKRGFAIIKSKFTDEELNSIKKDLTVTPYSPSDFGPPPASFPIFLESPLKLYLPKHYAFEKLGEPEQVKLSEGLDIDIPFNGSLRPQQIEVIEKFMKSCEKPIDDKTNYSKKSRGGLICVGCGFGKCHGKDTPIMMYDGTIKMVQDIQVGDQLMGDDSTPRTVLSLARGKEQMYRINPNKGNSYTVNESHILSLKCSTPCKYGKKGDIVDIKLTDYLNLPSKYHSRAGPLLGFRVPVNFQTKSVPFNPYIFGYWLGDGSSRGTGFSTQDAKVLVEIRKILKNDYKNLYISYISNYDYRITSITKGKGCNQFYNFLNENNLILNKHIPDIFKFNSREIRLNVLAGILDADGYLNNGNFELCLKNEKLFDDTVFLIRSLGFATYKKTCIKKCYNNGKIGTYFRCIISGNTNLIPTKINRKMAKERRQIKDVLATRISVEKLNIDEYYGFCIDGNHRYLLGDFTVTHNTVMGLNLISLLKKKTLVIVHKEFLVNQWKKRIEEYLPTAKVGTIQGPIIDYKDKDIVIGMLQSISMKEYSDEVFSEFGFAIIDECHHIAAEVFSRALPKINSMYQLGLSATPKRADGLSKVFHHFLGPVIYEAKKTNNTNVQVMVVHYHNNWDPGYNKEETMGFGKVCPVKMISNIVIYDRRNALISRIVMKLVLEGRKTLILSERRDHLVAIEGLIKDFTTVGYYVGGMKQKDLDKSEEMQVLLATYQMASEGMDIPSLDSVIFATPKSSIEQSIGRITRKVHDNPPIAYDIVDEFSIFPNQFKKRKVVYSKLKYKITHLHIKDHIHTTLEQLTNQIEAEVLTEEQMEELIESEIKKEESKFKTCLLED